MSVVSVPWGAWHGDGSRELPFPDSWQVQVCPMAGAPQISEAALQRACARLLEHRSIDARAIDSVAIVVDDITRPTPTQVLLPHVLDGLHRAGVPQDRVRIVVALGSHAAMSESDLLDKLGSRAVRDCTVIQHDPSGDLADVGVELDGIPVRINRSFLQADLKILMGSITPHPFAGFTGGGKMVLPGLANLEIIERTHRYVVMGFRGGLGVVEGNKFREEVEKVCALCDVDLIVDVVVNQQRQVAGVFAGRLAESYLEGVGFAREVCRTPLPEEVDVAVVNAYPKDTDLIQSENAFNLLRSAKRPFVRDGGRVVLITASSRGTGAHGLFSPGGPLYRKPFPKRWLRGKGLTIFSPNLEEDEVRSFFWSGYPFCTTWQEVLDELRPACPDRCRVAVFPCSSLQIGVQA